MGKSVWTYYALCRWLAGKQSFVWTLDDSDESKDRVPEHLVSPGTHHYVIFSTSSRISRWSRLNKTMHNVVIVTNQWTIDEIVWTCGANACLSGRKKNDHDHVSELFDDFVPTPRICLNLSIDDELLKFYKLNVVKALMDMEIEDLERIFLASAFLDMDMISRKLCLLRRDGWIPPVCHLPDHTIYSVQTCAANPSQDRTMQCRLYRQLSLNSQTRAAAGVFFEAVGQYKLQERVNLNCIPMVKLSGAKTDSGSRPQWHSCHIFLQNTAAHHAALNQWLSIDIKPSAVEEFSDNRPMSSIYLNSPINQHGLVYSARHRWCHFPSDCNRQAPPYSRRLLR